MVFHTHQDDDFVAEEKPDGSNVKSSPGNSKSSASSRHVSLDEDDDVIERASTQDPLPPHHDDGSCEKSAKAVSLELKRTVSRASNVLERVFTTRSIVDPPPPPDGGRHAWVQVACGWLVMFTTWVSSTHI